jgi:hypothetical protein
LSRGTTTAEVEVKVEVEVEVEVGVKVGVEVGVEVSPRQIPPPPPLREGRMRIRRVLPVLPAPAGALGPRRETRACSPPSSGTRA